MNAPVKTPDTVAWHLQGNWAPVLDEIDAGPLTVTGEIPRELVGDYVRAGMNPRSGHSDHWFAGTGMLHSVRLADGRAHYRNRFVRTPYYDGDLTLMGGMFDPAASPANTNIIRHAGHMMALEETHLPWAVDSDLNTLGAHTFGGALNGSMTAHPRQCPVTGELLFFGYQLARTPYLTYYRVDAAGVMVEAEPIDLPNPVMMHDWNVTRNHVVFMDLPVVFDLKAAMRGEPPLAFRREAGARLGVMKRNGAGGQVRWFEINPCYVFHPVNAYEEGDTIVIHVCRQEHAMAGGFENLYGGEATTGRLWRWTIDLAKGIAKEEQIDDVAADFPRVNDNLVGLKARFGYTASLNAKAPSLTLGQYLYKYDLGSGARITRDFGASSRLGEPIFVAREGATAEDEGWVMALSHDEATDLSRLTILNAQDFNGAPAATITMPRRIPYGAHGNWMPT
ncbi:MAG: carotenoid oxygenase family protein [Alphaproteobacteria bacterium]